MISIEDIAESEEELIDIIARARYDFQVFCDKIIQVTPKNEPLDIQPFHVHWAELFRYNKRTCIVAPRGSAKTTTLAVLTPLWIMYYEEYRDFLILAHVHERSKEIIADIRRYINSNELLSSLKPDSREDSWTKTHLDTSTHCQIYCKTATTDTVGVHPNFILCDEISKFRDPNIFYDSILPMANAHNANLCACGTPQSHLDLLAQLKDNPEFHYERYKAIKDDGTPLWEARYSLDKLEKRKKELTSLAFARQFMTEVAEENVQIFPSRVIVASYDPSISLLNSGKENGEYYGGIDLAMSPQGDYSVYAIVNKQEDKIVLSKIVRNRGVDYNSQLHEVIQLHENFNVRRWLVDKSVFGEAFIDDMRRNGIPCEPFVFDPGNRTMLINNLMRLFENGKIVIPTKNDGFNEQLVKILSEELSNIILDVTKTGQHTYRSVGKHDDTVMAFALAAYAAGSIGKLPIFFEAV